MQTRTNSKLTKTVSEDIHDKISNHSRDEILDYLTSCSHAEENLEGFTTRKLIKKLVEKKCHTNTNKSKSPNRTLSIAYNYFKSLFNSSSLYIYYLIKLIWSFLLKLHSVRVNLLPQDIGAIYSPENKKRYIASQNKFFTKALTALVDKAKLLFDIIHYLIKLTWSFLLKLHSVKVNLLPQDIRTIYSSENKKRYIASQKKSFTNSLTALVDKAKLLFNITFPKFTSSYTAAIVLCLCSLLALISSASSNSNARALAFRKYMPINWNVNGQVSNQEKEMIQNLIANNQIKTRVTFNKQDTTYLTSNSISTRKAVSPDTNFVMLPSNTFEHQVANGESILSISKKYRVSITDLIALNPDKDLVALTQNEIVQVPNNINTYQRRSIRPSSMYGRIPRNLIASRGINGHSKRFYSVNTTDKPMAWPVIGSKVISSYYGPRWGSFHPGIDVTAPVGTPIIATKAGVVLESGWSGGYGKCVVIDHGNGIKTRYGHASSLLVSKGQTVKAGQVIAKIGSTGWSTGPHLHYEISVNGSHHNPLKFL